MDIDYRKLAASGELLHERIRNDHTADSDSETEFTAGRGESVEADVVDDLRSHLDADFTQIGPYFGFENWPEDEALPEWISRFATLAEVLDESKASPSVPDVFETTPFVDVLWPIVEFESDRVFGHDCAQLTESGRRDFEGILLDDLVDVSAQALHVDFVSYLGENDPELLESDGRSSDSREWYEAYVSSFFDGRMEPFFREYSMAARFVATVTRQWRSLVDSFVSRLTDDSSTIRSRFDVPERDRVDAISSMGDAHDGGKRVLLVEFEGGTELLYKPRSIEPEDRFYEFESWLCEEFSDVPERSTPRRVVRSSYGWVEKVEPASHDTIDAVEDYYRSAGALACIAYVLNVSDCHVENIVSTSRAPTLVDAETVLELGASPAEADHLDAASELARHVYGSTVLGTYLFPFGTGVDRFSGLGLNDERDAELPELSWVDVNTDAMDIEYETPTNSFRQNLPTCDGELVPPHEFVDEIVDGFETTYDAIADARQTVRRKVVETFDEVECRKIVRDTRAYHTLLLTLSTPKYLRSGAWHGYKIQDVLSRRSPPASVEGKTELHNLDVERWDGIVEAERRSILRRDIPKFTVLSDDVGLYYDGELVVRNLTLESGVERACTKIEELSDDDERFQSGLIRACLENPGQRIAAHPGGFI